MGTRMEPGKKQDALDVVKEVQVHAVPYAEGYLVWMHTHGMVRHGKPEFEIRDVPAMFWLEAHRILNQVCSYVLNSGREIKAGENLLMGDRPMTAKTALPREGEEEHYRVPVLELVTGPLLRCDRCDGKD